MGEAAVCGARSTDSRGTYLSSDGHCGLITGTHTHTHAWQQQQQQMRLAIMSAFTSRYLLTLCSGAAQTRATAAVLGASLPPCLVFPLISAGPGRRDVVGGGGQEYARRRS